MAWTNLTFAFGSTLTSTKMTQLQDNFTAMATKASGAPAVQASTITEPTQAQMEAGTNTTLGVSPRAMNWHPGVAKVFASVTYSGGTPTLDASWNVTSITDVAVGILTFTLATDFSSTNYAVAGTSVTYTFVEASRAVGSVVIETLDDMGTARDSTHVSLVCFGDQ